VLARPLERYTDHTLVDAARLEAELVDTRARGYATTVDELEIGLTASPRRYAT